MIQIIVYTKPGCGLCKILKRELEKKKLPYTEKTSLKDFPPEVTVRTFPVLVYNGEIYQGPDTIHKIRLIEGDDNTN